ncbi:MAG: type III polyketide synthase, partial [Chloroflexota bacterium]
MTQVAAITKGFPPNYYTQDELIAALRAYWSTRHVNLDRLERFHRNVSVEGRYLALPLHQYPLLTGFGRRNDAWIQSALELGENVVCSLLDKAGLGA